MDEQIRQLAELIEDMTYDFGSHNMDGVCCENISHGEYRALRTVLRLDKCTMQDVAKSIAVTKSGATRIVSRLEEKKLVHRINDQNDGRVCCVQLSEEGKSLISRLTEEPAKRMAAILSAMTPDMRQILLIGLRAFVETALNQIARGDEQQKSVKVIGTAITKG
ncbi:MAG: MarR family transcriptional regulator [Syntrophaceae bacterium]|nr:MarR family transcriptional regulator [Syntrophaceae bacterium]